MSSELVGILSLVVLFGAIFIGFPIAFTLIVVSLGFGWLVLGKVVVNLMVLQTFAVMRDPTLASIPFFLFMGYLLERAGLMERLFLGFQMMFAGLRGSLYLAVLVTATIFAAATGIVGSSVTLLGVMAAPAMQRSGYDIPMSAGVIAAGGTLGILIPPSVMLIVMGPIVGVPVTDLFAGAVIPGLLLAGLYIVYALVRSHLNPSLGPPLPPELRASSWTVIVREIVLGMAPVVVIILATLGVIMAGIATPTDAGAVGAAAVLLLTLAYRRMSLAGFWKAMLATLETSCMILLLVAASNFYGAVFSRLGSASWIAEILSVSTSGRPGCCSSSSGWCSCSAGRSSGYRSSSSSSRSCCRWCASSASTCSGSRCWSRSACRPPGCRRRWRCRPTSCAAWCRTGGSGRSTTACCSSWCCR